MKFNVSITEHLVCNVEIEAATVEEAEMKAGENWDAGEYAHVKQFFCSFPFIFDERTVVFYGKTL